MSEEETQFERGARMLNEVYAGDVGVPPEGTMAFTDVMLRSLFAEVWDRDVLSIDQRRLLIMGVIAARGEADVFQVQAMAALKRGELTPDQLRECIIMLAPYAGYPSTAGLNAVVEATIADFTAGQS